MKIAICDDEKIFRDKVLEYIKKYIDVYDIYEYENGLELIEAEEDFDIIFLDIEMPIMNGMDTATKYRDKNEDTLIIFLTGYVNYVFDSFKVNAFRYLKKPINDEEFKEAMTSAMKLVEDNETVTINNHGVKTEIKIKNITYVESFGDGTYIYDKNGNYYESVDTLKTWESMLQNRSEFYKISKSFIVSMKYIEHYEEKYVEMYKSNQKLPISRRCASAFRKEYYRYIMSS